VNKYCCVAGYRAGRHDAYGTWFIRILVATFYRHSCHRDIDELFKIVSCQMNDPDSPYNISAGVLEY